MDDLRLPVYEKLQALGIDYVVLHTQPIDAGLPGFSDSLNATGYAYLTPDEAAAMVSALPNGLVSRQLVADDGLVLVLAD